METKKNKNKNNTIQVDNVPIRVLYKKPNKLPEVKIIDNILKLKKTIIKKNLDIIPYERVYIICQTKKFTPYLKQNIILTFYSIYGDLILVDIDKKKREFKSLSEDNIIWYLQDLINKSYNMEV